MLGRLSRILRKFGKAGETAAWVVDLIDTKVTLGIIVSGALGVAAAVWKSVFDFFSDPHVKVGIEVWLAGLWTYVGLSVVRSFGKPINMLPTPDYRHCIAPEGLVVGLSADQSSEHAFSVLFNFRNVGNWPIRIHVEKFDVRIEDRAGRESASKLTFVLPRVGPRSIQSGGFKKELMKDTNTGSIDLVLSYGDPDGKAVRAYKFKAKLNFAFVKDDNGKTTLATVGQ
jgi:hypothetical protein